MEKKINNIEAQLVLAREEAEKAIRLKDKFVSLIAHDLRGPAALNSRLLHLLLNDRDKIPFTPEQKKIIDLIIDNTDKMKLMIDDILSLSRIRVGVAKPVLRYFNPRKIADNILKKFEDLARQKNVNIINNIPEDFNIFNDAVLTGHILDNFISNSVKFCSEGDKITLFRPDNLGNTIAVDDTGIGIPPEKMKVLFEYGQEKSTPGTAGEIGTGFGLPLSLDIVRLMDGNISVESNLDRGTTFYIHLPDQKPKVLVVDDDEIFRYEQKIFLNKLGVIILEAYNGEEALTIIKEAKPDLIITDLNMPLMDGYELLKRIKDNPETAPTPVIVITGLANLEKSDELFKMGANDFFLKKFEMDELIIRVRRFLW